MRFDPVDPIWPGRDRFVLSNGHASMLLWSMLHLTGTRAVNADYERLGDPSVTLDDIRHFRQLGSKAPGHPEYRMVSGVETTTGPLGQGIATSVGMAIGERWLADRYNRPGFEVFDYNTYAICGDGCLMEGVSCRGGIARGPPGPGPLVLDLGQQPHHHRGEHRPDVHRGRRRPLSGLRVERAARGRRQRHRSHRARAPGLSADQGPADVHHPRQQHRLRLAQQTGHGRRPRRAARSRGNPPHQARLRLAGRRDVPRSGRCPRALRRRRGEARRRSASQMDGALRCLPIQAPGSGGGDRSDATT